jgi:hypothetical protein
MENTVASESNSAGERQQTLKRLHRNTDIQYYTIIIFYKIQKNMISDSLIRTLVVQVLGYTWKTLKACMYYEHVDGHSEVL